MSIILKDLGPGDIDWLVAEHSRLYARDEGFDASFGRLVRQILEAFARDHDPARERAFIAWDGTERLGSIFCVAQDAQTAKLRLFFLVPEARGRGLGKRMLSECMGFARACGYRRMVLWTHESHAAACALYRHAGWRMTRSEPRHSFGVDVVEQAWETAL
ncbi:GNAT family N-acetyltransferase [Pseudoponticoccus marisrubri]|uniref:Acetyltransferase n=1 Tax=Pseudoponticoccus marisrubri TaxID=1685382 RepID=A0A0W7WP25_9RHOB|nr:GNAT family N-acetyltransferase [Pseudoponticoccus marisrubri]KUF12260.1 acetyltransferase [Pseudoponticoccus marisrubri]